MRAVGRTPGTAFDFGPDTIRVAYSVKGFMYYVNVCPTECLDVARSLWILGAAYISAYSVGAKVGASWRYINGDTMNRECAVGGYSNA